MIEDGATRTQNFNYIISRKKIIEAIMNNLTVYKLINPSKRYKINNIKP